MITDIAALSIEIRHTIRSALRRLDESAQGILLLLDENGCLQRTITDGDLRRLLLAGATLDDDLRQLPQHRPVTAAISISQAEALRTMREHGVRHLPLLDGDERVAGILRLADLDSPILLSTPHMGESEMDFVAEAFDSNWVAPLGPNVDAFEQELAERVGIAHAAAVSSGTAAIHLALVLLGVKHGDTVFCSSLTFVASANPILYQGATPVFIDSEPDSWNMSLQALETALQDAEALGQLPKAVIVVNLYGQSADMDPLLALCDRFAVPVIEDAAESLGADYKGKASGTLGRIGIYSFNGNKIITTSGGGMLVSDDGDLVERARFLATQARDPAPYYLHTQVGYNYRMSNVLAGIGRGQLRVLAERVEARRNIFERYVQGLADVDAIAWMPEASYGRANRWLSCCLLRTENTSLNVPKLIDMLAAERIEARHLWRPMHRQPLFESCRYYRHGTEESVSDRLFEQGLCLPSGSNMTEGQQERVIETLRSALVAASG